ncbi:MAG TPA: tRNA uridine-5-carboxymethylaminomethyl(34) synthesis GTPase MnmE [Bacteroidales bacterium]|nr:tRNA uridine-5-carboxymethylaminomethyl(34) synthesis GTPase MnmE [Bacteroidales bacterium]
MNISSTFSGMDDTICALSTPPGMGAIAIIRLSGNGALDVLSSVFRPLKKSIKVPEIQSHTITLGTFGAGNETLDEVLVSVFRAPHSYTGEDVVEISCHGSVFIQQKILETLTSSGARMARAGEFTLRAFLNHKFDLTQAEAVADLIASNAKSSHDLALSQMRGGFATKIKNLRQRLVDLASLLELELDFSEDDVEFADRRQLLDTIESLDDELSRLAGSFKLGNVIKQGIPVAIVGKPNVGKSTLLNALLNEERAIVSEIPGTTRDTIEDTLTIKGVSFRFIDTAGLRLHSGDIIENLGIGRTYETMQDATVILYVFDMSQITADEIDELLEEFREHIDDPEKHFIMVGNKTDLMVEVPPHVARLFDIETVFISAKRKENINLVIESLLRAVNINQLADSTIVSNARHHEAITKTLSALESARQAIENNTTADLVAIDIHSALYHLGTITGEVTTNEILGNIFGKFCIGK